MRTRKHRQESCGNNNRIEVKTTLNPGTIDVSGNGNAFTDYLPNSINDGTWWRPAARTYIFEGPNPVSKITIDGYHWDDPTTESCMQRSHGVGSTNFVESDYPCVSKRITGFFGEYDNGSYLDITVTPVTETTPLVNANDTSMMFPLDDRITIRSNVRCNEYEWEYCINGGSPQYNAVMLGTTQEFNLSARDLLGNDYLSYINKNITFRAKYQCNGAYTKPITMPIRFSAPHIRSVDYEMPRCHGEMNAKLHIKFDRALHENEKLYISFKEDGYMNIKEEIFIDPSTLIASVENLPSGEHSIGLYGLYRTGQNLSDTVNTYISGVAHKYTITIPERPKVSYEILRQDSVHCNSGKDGKIWLKATGGVDKYYAYLFERNKQDTLQQIVLLKDIPQSFNELKKGSYEVHLVDTNYCVPPANPVQYMDVKEPVQPLRIYNSSYEEPLGFGLSNGKAWAYITGGTGVYTAVWTDSQGNVLASKSLIQEGDSRRSEVEGLKKGMYYLYVTDQNYPLVNPKTQENECGCIAQDSIFVDEPPKLLVTVSEKHYVTCNGDNDGELVAHAVGGRPHMSQSFPYTYQWYKVDRDSIALETYNKNDSILTDLYSARYVVRVTDRNGIQATSSVFLLDQPDPLVVKTNILQQIQCDGEETGRMEAIVPGGTPPYFYFWETGDTTRMISGLPKGIYSVYVRDGRYLDSQIHFCSAEAHGEIRSPNPLRIAASLQHPTCNAYSDGKINLEISGGVAPYFCRWSDNITTKDRTGLPEGSYQITVTDANGCFVSETYELWQPEALIVNLGDGFTLCKNRSETLNKTLGMAGISYSWAKDGREVSTDSLYTVSEAGVYRLTVTNEAGCSAYDEITVNMSEVELIPDFVIASRIPNHTNVYAVNITRIDFDRIEWILPQEAVVTEQSDHKIQFSIARNGSYTVGMTAYKGDCRDILYKTVEVLDKNEIEDYNDAEPFLKRFIVYPNPNDGNFTVLLELREVSGYSLQLYNSQGMLVEKKQYTDSLGGEIRFDNSALSPGVYYLRFLSAETTSIFKIIVQ